MKPRYIVIASIYSGRPDPRWDLSEEQADHFTSWWQQAALSEFEVNIPSKSGYKGIRMHAGDKLFFIYREAITCIEKEMRTSKKDEQRIIEIFLLKTAPEQIQQVLRQLNIL